MGVGSFYPSSGFQVSNSGHYVGDRYLDAQRHLPGPASSLLFVCLRVVSLSDTGSHGTPAVFLPASSAIPRSRISMPNCWGWPAAVMSRFKPGRQPGAEREEGT